MYFILRIYLIIFIEKILMSIVEKYSLCEQNFKRFTFTFLFWSGLSILNNTIQLNISDQMKSRMYYD